jgi:hypothetical protein
MQNILETIDKASKTFMLGHVVLNEEKIETFKIQDLEDIETFFSPPEYLSTLLKEVEKEEAYKIIHVYNAINASLQYCFFMGNAHIRFDGIDSFWVMRMLDNVFKQHEVVSVEDIYKTKESIINLLVDSNITLLRSRVQTVEEVFEKLDFYAYGNAYVDVNASVSQLKKLVCFKQDIFFKKGLFAVMITGRMLPELQSLYPAYKTDLHSLPVPADYQIPKMLRHYGLIEFSDELASLTDNSIPLQENSEMELNIRAATVLACDMLAEMNGVSVDVVDAYLFMHRKGCDALHHLCVTERY